VNKKEKELKHEHVNRQSGDRPNLEPHNLQTRRTTDAVKIVPSFNDGQKESKPRKIQSIDGMRVVLVLALVCFTVGSTFSALSAKATLVGISISTVRIKPKSGSCPGNNMNVVNVNNTTIQNGHSGNVLVSGNSGNIGNVSSGNVSNTNTTTITINQSNC
jgi:hypothetical protein